MTILKTSAAPEPTVEPEFYLASGRFRVWLASANRGLSNCGASSFVGDSYTLVGSLWGRWDEVPVYHGADGMIPTDCLIGQFDDGDSFIAMPY